MALQLEQRVVTLDDAEDGGEPDAVVLALGAEERLEDALLGPVSDTRK